MPIKYTKLEQETIIVYNEADQTAEVYTHSQKLKNRLAKICEARPGDIVLKRSDEASVTYEVPKSWIRVQPKKKRVPLTDEQSERLRNNLVNARATRNINASQD